MPQAIERPPRESLVFVWLDDAVWRDDGGDERVRRDVEGVVASVGVGRGDELAVDAFDFVLRSLFDGDVAARFEDWVESGVGGGDVERNVVVVGEDGECVGADFVCDVEVLCDAVGADDDGVDEFLLHEVCGGVVGDERAIDVVVEELPGRESCAL